MSSNPFLIAISRKSPYTQRAYRSILNTYLKFISYKQPFNTVTVNQFLNHLESEKSQSYVSSAWSVLKLFFEVYNKPFINIPCPKVDLYRQAHPTLSIEDITQLISIVREQGTLQEKAFWAIGTTFGLRNSELCQITQDNINKDKIFIDTKKGGFPRWHLIPEQIAPQVLNYTFKPIPIITGWLLFRSIFINHNGGITEKGFSWHSIRRRLIKELDKIDSLTEKDLLIFFRYAQGKGSMIGRYARLDSDEDKLFEIDKKVFQSHPFLRFWEN